MEVPKLFEIHMFLNLRGLILSIFAAISVKSPEYSSSHWFCVRYEGAFSIYFVRGGAVNSSFTETELNNVFLINYVDGPWQNAIHSWETVVFKHEKKTIFSKIVQHGQIYFSMSPSDQSKFRKTHLYYHPYKMNI